MSQLRVKNRTSPQRSRQLCMISASPKTPLLQENTRISQGLRAETSLRRRWRKKSKKLQILVYQRLKKMATWREIMALKMSHQGITGFRPKVRKNSLKLTKCMTNNRLKIFTSVAQNIWVEGRWRKGTKLLIFRKGTSFRLDLLKIGLITFNLA